jgi:hypothetical protein
MEPQNTFKPPAPPERYLTVGQVSRRRNLSSDTIRRLYINEPGVIVITKPNPRKRIFRSLRIPETVERRVFARMTNGGGMAA